MEYSWTTIHDGMDVCDTNGEKIGTVGKVYAATPAPTGGTATGTSTTGHYLKVDTGFLGLGKDYYIPAEYVSGVVDDKVMLNMGKDGIKSMDWDEKPADLRDID